MASLSLDELLRQSQQLAGPSSGSGLPSIRLGLDQIESQSRKLAGRSAILPAADSSAALRNSTRAHFSHVTAGADADELADTIEAARVANAYEPLRPLEDTDVAGYLRHEHQQVILAALEEGRRNTQHALYRTIDRSLNTGWDTQKSRIVEDLGSFTPTPSAGAASGPTSLPGSAQASTSLQMHSKMLRYVRVVQHLNDTRLAGDPFPLAHAYSKTVAVLQASAGGVGGAKLLDAWAAVQHIVREHDVINGQFSQGAVIEREYAPAYTDPQTYLASSMGLALRQELIRSSMRYLENSFHEHFLSTVAPNPGRAELLSPSSWNRIITYCRAKLIGPDQQWPSELESIQINDSKLPIWACIFFLLRSGDAGSALKLARMIETRDHSFVGPFQAWIESPDRLLPKSLRDRLYIEYTSRIRPRGSQRALVDPYKLTLYKLIGRFDVRESFPPTLTADSADWLWLQLAMVRELPIVEGGVSADDPVPAKDTYTLGDVAATVISSGEARFDPKGISPYSYFKLLLLVGQFERAIAFLASRPTSHVDAVQFAITLTYYGLLRVPPSTATSSRNHRDNLIVDTSCPDLAVGGVPTTLGVAYFDFARLIQRYIRTFVESAPQEALQHVYLIALNLDAPRPIGDEQVALCFDMVKSVVLESKDYYTLLGDPRNDGSVSAGSILKYAKLLRVPQEEILFTSVVNAAAAAAEATQPKDAVLLYELAGKPDKTISVLTRELADHLFDVDNTPHSGTATGVFARGTSFQAAQDLTTMAQEIIASYEQHHRVPRNSPLSSDLETLRLLLELKRAVAASHANEPEEALRLIEVTDLIPLWADVATVTRRANEWNTDRAKAPLRANLGDILLLTMSALARLHTSLRASLYAHPDGQRKVADLRTKARTLLSFAGLVRHLISPAAYAQLVSLSPQ